MSTNYQHKPGNGTLFKNDKQGNDRRPDYKGKVMLMDGSLWQVSLWKGQTQAGDVKLSIKMDKPVEGAARPMDSHNQAKGNGYQPQGDDSDIPF